MNDNDELNDGAVLSALRDSISRLPMPAVPHLEAIRARGRARRRRRLGGLSLAGAGACAALVVGLAGSWGSASPVLQARPAPQRDVPAVHLAAFSVVAGPGGATTLTLYPGQVANPNAVRRALAEHGIPALVTSGRFCRTAAQPAPGVGEVVVLPYRPNRMISGPGPTRTGRPGPTRTGGPGPTRTGGPGPIVVYGSKIPSGVELSIGYRQDPQEYEISFTLIQAGAPLTCTSIPDLGPHPND